MNGAQERFHYLIHCICIDYIMHFYDMKVGHRLLG